LTGKGLDAECFAVLDEDVGQAASLAQHFADRGCDAQAFARVEDLVGKLEADLDVEPAVAEAMASARSFIGSSEW
jgi:hypothetical protein